MVIELGEGEARHPPDRVEREVARSFEARARRRASSRSVGHAVEAAQADVDRVDGASSDQRDELVAGLLELEPPLHQLAVSVGHLDGALVAEEVRCVQEVDVQRVALDPLAAVDEAAQVGERPVDGHPAERLDGVARAHLVRDGADAADASRDVGRLRVGAAAAGRPRRSGEARRSAAARRGADRRRSRRTGRPHPRRGPGRRRCTARDELPDGSPDPLRSDRQCVLSRRNVGASTLKVLQEAHDGEVVDAESRELSGHRHRVGILRRAEAAVAASVVGRAQRTAAGMGDRDRGMACRAPPSRTRSRAACTRRTRCGRARSGRRSPRKALMTSRSCPLSIGQPRSSKSTGTWAEIGVDVASVEM